MRKKMLRSELPCAFFNGREALAVRSSGQATGDPFDWDHLAFLGNESGWASGSNEGCLQTSLVQDAEHLAVGGVRDFGLSNQVVFLDAIASGDAVFAQQQTQAIVLGQVVYSFGLAFDQGFAQFVTSDCFD